MARIFTKSWKLLPGLSWKKSEFNVSTNPNSLLVNRFGPMKTDGLPLFFKLFKKHFSEPKKTGMDGRNAENFLLSSCYVSGIPCPLLENEMDGDAVAATLSTVCFHQRFTAANNFFGSSESRFDSIRTIKSSSKENALPLKIFRLLGCKRFLFCPNLWPQFKLYFIHFRRIRNCLYCHQNLQGELCFVQWY